MLTYVPGYTVTFTHFLKILCYSVIPEKKMPSKRALWNKNVFISHKVRSLLDSQFTTSPYFIFARKYFKTGDFPFYAHSSVLLCSLTLRITLDLLFWNVTFGARDTTIPVPFLPSPKTPVSAADLLVFTHLAPLGLALCISWLMVLSSWSWPHDYHVSSSC